VPKPDLNNDAETDNREQPRGTAHGETPRLSTGGASAELLARAEVLALLFRNLGSVWQGTWIPVVSRRVVSGDELDLSGHWRNYRGCARCAREL